MVLHGISEENCLVNSDSFDLSYDWGQLEESFPHSFSELKYRRVKRVQLFIELILTGGWRKGGLETGKTLKYRKKHIKIYKIGKTDNRLGL